MCSNFFLAKAKRYYIIKKLSDLKENVLFDNEFCFKIFGRNRKVPLRYRKVCAFVSISVRIRIYPPGSGSISQSYGSGSEFFYETVAEE